jgi:hypothetical protein
MLSRDAIFSRLKIGSGGASAERHQLSKQMVQSLREQFSNLGVAELSSYSCEQRHSGQRGAKSDILVYDADGVLQYEGRSFSSTEGISFWKHSAS